MRKHLAVFLCALFVLTPIEFFSADKKGVSFPMKYEGGSIPLDRHDGLNVKLETDLITIKQGKASYSVKPSAVNEISYGNDVHRRVGTAIGVGAATFGIGLMMLLIKTKKHYVGMTWNEKVEGAEDKKGGAVFKVGKGEYRGFITALEGLTGLKAVNADISGPGGTSKWSLLINSN